MIIRLPMVRPAARGAIKPIKGIWLAQNAPMIPTGSLTTNVAPRIGVLAIVPSNLSAQAAAVNRVSSAVATSDFPDLEPVCALILAANSSARADRFSARKYRICARRWPVDFDHPLAEMAAVTALRISLRLANGMWPMSLPSASWTGWEYPLSGRDGLPPM